MNTVGLIQAALDDYEQGRLNCARNTLLLLTQNIHLTDENIHQFVMESLTNPAAAAEGWIDLAIDAITRELGEQSHKMPPVRRALVTAINLLS
jgi:hypothetical protein